MRNVILQLFKRNPFSSAEEMQSDNGEKTLLERSVHQLHQYRILSYFDGMCIQKFEDVKDTISDKPCKDCIKQCPYGVMGIHAERKKLILFSDEESYIRIDRVPNTTIDDAPFVALVSIGMLYMSSESITDKDMMRYVRRQINAVVKKQLRDNDIVFYQLFRSFSDDDLYLLINANSWTVCERLITNLLKQLYPSDTQKKNDSKFDVFQTYTILGYDRKLEDPKNLKQYNSILNQEYVINMQMQTIPGISPEEAIKEIKRSIPGAEIKSIVGHYDLDINATLSMGDFIHLMEQNKILGWSSKISIGTETSIDFDVSDEAISSADESKMLQANKKYYSHIEDQRGWLSEQQERIVSLKKQCKDCRMPEALIETLLSLYRSICQRLVRPQIWGAYNDVRMLIQRYFYLLEVESRVGESATIQQKIEMSDSMIRMINEISVLSNDRLFLDYPSYEHVVNNVYEKGAYEDLIQALKKWMQMLEQYAWLISSNEETNENERRKEDNGLFHVEFSLVPILYGQTKSYLLFPSAEHLKRLVIVQVSSGEMVKIDEILPSLAHEVGHYAGICDRLTRLQTLFFCSTLMLLIDTGYHKTTDNYSPLYNGIVEAGAKAATYLLAKYEKEIKKIGMQTKLEVAGEKIHDLIMDGIRECENDEDESWDAYLMTLSEDGMFDVIQESLLESFDKKCYEMIDNMLSLIREISADVFMILSTNISFNHYMTILDQQLVAYYITEKTDEKEDSKWLMLYGRIISITSTLYNQNINSLEKMCSYIETQNANSTYIGKKMIKTLTPNTEDCSSFESDTRFILQMLLEFNDLFFKPYIEKIKEQHDMATNNALSLRRKIRGIYASAIKENNDIIQVTDKIKRG